MLKIIATLSLLLSAQGLAEDKTVRQLPLPTGYERGTYAKGSYSHWLQNAPLKKTNTIDLYDGRSYKPGSNWYQVAAVLDFPLLFDQDLEQCADFAMRLWAEYHAAKGKHTELYLFNYDGSKQKLTSASKYRNFLRLAMANSNSHSIKKGAKKITPEDLRPGDMFVQNNNGGIGHVSVIIDVANSKTTGKPDLYQVGFSFMPAQEFHIEKAPNNRGWFTREGFEKLLKQRLGSLGEPVLRRF
ncbi:MAG: hypothetical protein ACI9UA_003310 [Pseudoalteromonas tetraodonis]|jgi:hypothetical protein